MDEDEALVFLMRAHVQEIMLLLQFEVEERPREQREYLLILKEVTRRDPMFTNELFLEGDLKNS